MIMKSDNWQGTLIASLFSAAILYSVFIFLEKEKWYKKLLVEKEPGEIKKSILMLFMIFSVMVCNSMGALPKAIYYIYFDTYVGNG